MLRTMNQHVPEWPKWIMFGPQHAPAGQTRLNWARKAPRVPPAACHMPTCARMAKMNHVWPTPCPGRSVMPELGSTRWQSPLLQMKAESRDQFMGMENNWERCDSVWFWSLLHMTRCCWIQYHIPLNTSDSCRCTDCSFSSSTVAWRRLQGTGNWSNCNNQGKMDTETSGVVYSLYPFWLLDGEWEQEGRLLVMELTFLYVDAYDHN
jgi:hypothetical protein